MSLQTGSRLGPYEIASPLGSGGMGEVYRAHDSRLGRDVAIKVLPSFLTADPASLARFEREAKAIGALNHPNIVNVYDVGSENGVSYVVMELLEGETLRARLQGSAAPTTTTSMKTPKPGSSGGSQAHGLPRKKALDIAHQIAQGLAAAHARGIVHRDLKPENIFLTNDGRVKILDFGLARAVVQQTGEAQTQMSPAPSSDSVPGMVLGTVGYMAPEQVRGQPADQRADIFAFGAVLYEMLTGERAFDCETPIETMSAILKADPLEQPVAAVAISGPLEPLVRHCLEKQPDERFQSARDLAFQLQAIASGAISTSTAERAVGAGRGGARRWITLGAVAVAALAAGIVIDRMTLPKAPEETTMTVAVLMPPGVRVLTGPSPARSGGLAVSRDGLQIAFAGNTATTSQIYVRSLESPIARAVPGTDGAAFPSWSPDGRRLAFFQGGKLKIVGAEGGSPQAVADMRNPRAPAAWGDDDTLLYHVTYQHGLMRVPADGGTSSEVLPVSGPDVSWFSPQWLPGGRRFLVVRFAYADEMAKEAGIYVGSVDSKETTLLVAGPISEIAIGDRELFYRRGTELVAQPFDADSAKLTGQPRVLSNHVSMVAAGGGIVAYFDPPRGVSQENRITMFSRTGAILSHVGEVGTFRDPRLSPDGRLLAVARAGDTGVFSIWTYDLARNIDSRVTGASFVSPAWTRDGASIIAGRAAGLARFDRGAGVTPQLIRPLPGFANVLDISPDGREALLHLVSTLGADVQLASIALDGKSDPRPLAAPEPVSPRASFSPDGKWIAFVAREGTAQRLFVKPYPGSGARIPVTGGLATYPRWRGDGRELYFVGSTGPDTSIMVVPVTWTGSAPDFGTPQELFKVHRPVLSNLGYDVTSDGQKFVIIISGDPDPSPLTVRVRVR